MNISIELSEQGIQSAIRLLQSAIDNIETGTEQAVEILAKEGAYTAQRAYGGMAYATDFKDDRFTSSIVVTGDAPIIAEFGAGYGTMEDHPFAANAPVPIKVASYSKMNYDRSMYGGLFYITNHLYPGEGYWLFGGEEYDRVEPRHGLLNAYDYIVGHATEIAKEVIKL